MTRQEFFARVDGGELGGWTDGAGPPVLVLHGGPGLSCDLVTGLVEELLPDYRTALFQQRGLEPSLTTGAFTIDEAICDVAAVLDALGWEQAYLLGHSWGGHLAVHCAVAVPERWLGVLAVDPLGAVGDGGNASFEAEMLRRTPEADRRRAQELDQRAQRGEGTEAEAAESLRILWPAYFAEPADAPPMPAVRLSVEAYGGLFGSLLERLPALEAALSTVNVPFGVAVGAASPIPPAAGIATAARIPGAWSVVIEGAGHLPWVEAPGSVRAALDRLTRGRS